MHHDHNSHAHAHDSHGHVHGSLKSYLIGFVASIFLTVVPFWVVMHPTMSHDTIMALIYGFAVIQILVHLVYFLHMNGKSEERWNMVAFAFTVMVLALLVLGSVWIMYNANSNLMPVPDLTHQE